MLALLNLPFAMSIDTSSAFSLSPFFRFYRVNQAVMNFDKGNIGVKDGIAIHNQGLYKLSDIVEKLRDLKLQCSANLLLLALFYLLIHLLKVVLRPLFVCTFPKNRDGLAALIFGNLTENQKKIAFNAIENLKNGDRLKADLLQIIYL
jgi:hypothetical protein